MHPDLSIYGDKEWGNFGYSVITGDIDSDGHCDLIVSAPFAGRYVTMPRYCNFVIMLYGILVFYS